MCHLVARTDVMSLSPSEAECAQLPLGGGDYLVGKLRRFGHLRLEGVPHYSN